MRKFANARPSCESLRMYDVHAFSMILSPVLICTFALADIRKLLLEDDDEFILISSDGLWFDENEKRGLSSSDVSVPPLYQSRPARNTKRCVW